MTTDPASGSAPASKPGKSSGIGCLFVIALVVVGFGFKACFSGSNGPSQGDALVSCKHQVAEKLANPATADFDLLSMSQTETLITGDLTAETGFGVKKALHFTCSVAAGVVTSADVAQE